MVNRLRLILPLLITIILVDSLQGQTITDKNLLSKMSKDLREMENINFAKAKQLAKQKGWFLKKVSPNGKVTLLIGVDEMGNPKYVSTFNNTIAAATTRANELWPGGSSGLNLSGSSNSVKGKIAIWGWRPCIDNTCGARRKNQTNRCGLCGRACHAYDRTLDCNRNKSDCKRNGLSCRNCLPDILGMMNQKWLLILRIFLFPIILMAFSVALDGVSMEQITIGTAILQLANRRLMDLAIIVQMLRFMILLLIMPPTI